MSDALPLPCGAPAAPAPGPADGDLNPAGTLVAATLASSLAFVLGSIIDVALPRMQADFGVDAAGAQWIVTPLSCRWGPSF